MKSEILIISRLSLGISPTMNTTPEFSKLLILVRLSHQKLLLILMFSTETSFLIILFFKRIREFIGLEHILCLEKLKKIIYSNINNKKKNMKQYYSFG